MLLEIKFKLVLCIGDAEEIPPFETKRRDFF
jgi:hypothetical protein